MLELRKSEINGACWLVPLIVVLVAAVSAIPAWGQSGNRSQRPLPLPERSAGNVEQQFRVMQHLQRLFGSDQQSAAGENDDSDSSVSDLPFDAGEIASKLQGTGLPSAEQVGEWTKDLNPDQREALRQLAQQFQTETQKSGKAPQSPAELQDMLQDFLRNRQLPEFERGNNPPQLPGLPPSGPLEDASDGRQQNTPDNGVAENQNPERRNNRNGDNERVDDEAFQLPGANPSQQRFPARNLPQDQGNGDNRGKRERDYEARGSKQDDQSKIGTQPKSEIGTQPRMTPREGPGTSSSMQQNPSTQELIEQLSRNPEQLPPIQPPPHSENQDVEGVESESGERYPAEKSSNSEQLRRRAIERQNQSLWRSERRADQPGAATDGEDSGSAEQPSSVDSERVRQLRETAKRNGLGEALRRLYQDTQEDAKQEAIREAKEKAQKEREEAERQAENERQRRAANIQSSTRSSTSSADQDSESGFDSERSRNSDARSKPPRGRSSTLEGIVDQEMLDSLFKDQRELERLARELRSRMAEEQRGKRQADSASRRDESSSGATRESSRRPGLEKEIGKDNQAQSKPDPAAESSEESFDMDPLGVTNPTSQAEGNDASNSFVQTLAEFWRDWTARGTDAGEFDFGPPDNDVADTNKPASALGGLRFGLPSIPFMIAALVFVAAVAWWYFRSKSKDSDESERRAVYTRMMPTNIRSSDDLIKAFHCVALASRAAPPSWWTHPKTAETLAATSPGSRSAVYTLARLYEVARYSPEGGQMTQDQLLQANEALVQLKGI